MQLSHLPPGGLLIRAASGTLAAEQSDNRPVSPCRCRRRWARVAARPGETIMADGAALTPSLKNKVSAEEWQVRVDLAACYRLVGHFGWDDGTATHISARVPGEDAFLLNPHGLFFDEITASSLVKMDFDNNVLLETGYPANPAGFTIHSAVLSAREDVNSVLHTHTRAGMAVSAMKCGLLPITQTALRFHNRISYHDYEGIADDWEERQRLIRDLGPTNKAMMLHNHGLLVAGAHVPEAFHLIAYLEKSCQSQLDAMNAGTELIMPSGQVAEHTAQQFDNFSPMGERDWPGHLRRLDRVLPGYDS